MTPTQLAFDLGEFLKSVHADYRCSDERVKNNELIVAAGFLKQKETASEDQFPHIVIRINKVNDTLDGSSVQLFIIQGTYCKDVEVGWMEITNFVEKTRQAILAHPVIANKYRLVLDEKQGIETELPPDQPYPFWVGYITVRFDIEPIREELIY